MHDLAKKSREAMKAKARRLASEKDQKVDSSDWTPSAPLNADVKTGMRPIGGGREYKAGGKVASRRADRPGRATGGKVEKEIGIGMANKDVKAANAKRPGAGAHIGGMKHGGRTKKNIGGVMEVLSPAYGLLRAAQRGGRDEERDTNEQMKGAAIANLAKRKDGGGVYDKKALGAIDPRAKRAAAQHYKRGGKAGGGSKETPPPYEAMRSEERMGRMKVEEKNELPSPKEAAESAARVGDVPEGRKSGGKKWIQSAIKHPGALRKSLGVKEGEKIPAKKLEAAAEKGGKLGQRARLAQTLKRVGRATGGKAPNVTVMVLDKGAARPQMPGGAMPPVGMPVPMPTQMGAMGAPGPGPMMPPGAVGGAPPAPMPPVARKSGGRITKVASSYKDMEAGAVSGEGRLQKTDIAKKHKDAPARKAGGRISRVAKSYKDMTAGAGDGEGRLQKTDIARAHRA